MTFIMHLASRDFFMAISIFCSVVLLFSGVSCNSGDTEIISNIPSDHGSRESTDKDWCVSEQDISQLPEHATYEDVACITKGQIIGDGPAFFSRAKEGGMYMFMFGAENETSAKTNEASSGKQVLAVIIRFPSEDSLSISSGSEGVFVYPAKRAGIKYTIPERSN